MAAPSGSVRLGSGEVTNTRGLFFWPRAPSRLPVSLVFGGVIAVLAVLGTRGSPVRRAAVLAAAAALTWALEATLLKTAPTPSPPPVSAACSPAGRCTRLSPPPSPGTVLQQAALHVGPLSVSQPLLVITDPFASIILSVWLFGERFTDIPAKITVAVPAFAVMAAGVTVLTRTAPTDLTPSAPARS